MSASRLSRTFLKATRSHRLYTTSASAKKPARLRFAPSPTGHLHLGGLRTALFNHLLARSLGGKWILRIEDTDQTRLVPGSVQALQETLEWAKLDYDEGPSAGGSKGPYVQSERLDLYRSYAERMIAQEKAYRDFRAESNAPSNASRGPKHMPLRDSYIPPTEAEAKHLISLGKPHVVRLRTPTDALSHHDLVYGDLHFPSDPNKYGTEDPILLKSNGWPTYHLANVVDDHEMGITHVLRGEEWLPSLPKHLWLYKALGLEPPEFAHLPLLVNADGTKLSKRTGDVRVESYREKGIEPEALNNFLGLMGYNNLAYHQYKEPNSKGKPGGEEDSTAFDVLTMAEMIRGFDIDHVSRSRATVDLSKLYYLNARHLSLKLEDKTPGGGRDELVAKVTPKLSEVYPDLVEQFKDEGFIENLLMLTKGTSPTLFDIPASAEPLFRKPKFGQDEVKVLFSKNSLINTHFGAAVNEALQQFSQLDANSGWTKDAIHDVIARLPKILSDATPPSDAGKGPKSKVKKAAVLAPLRFAISARERGAPLADLFLFLGREETSERLKLAQQAVERGELKA